jgi:PAS domain S-box-containing protein
MAAPADHSAPWASEAQFRQLIDAMPQIAWILRADGSAVEYINAQWLAYTGLSYESSLRDPNQAIHPDDQPAAAAAWAHALRYRTPYSMELRLRRSDGSYRWFLVRCAPVQDAHDTLSAWFGTSTDIHEQHEARRDTQFLAELAELIRCAEGVDELLEAAVQLAAGYFAVERCYFAEMALAEGSFQIRREFRGDLPPLAGSYRIADYPAEVVRRLGRGQMIVVDDAATDAPSSAVYAHSYAPYGLRARIVVPFLRDGAWVSNLVVASSQPRRWQARETTLLEQMAERVWLAVEKLRTAAALRANEARLQLLYAQERAARAEAEEASRLKDEFLATVSHELRTPLTALLGYIQLLQQRPRDETYVARTLEQIARSARAQAQLTEDLLDVSRIISGKLRIDPRPIDMRAVVEAALETVALAIEAKQQRLAYDVDPTLGPVVGDPNRLQQVVWNLLTNAVKFTPPGGTIDVGLRRAGGHARICVRDSGVGISEAFLPYVFDRFRQADGTSTRRHGGLGLGLAIARHLVELHGGTLQAASAGPGHGAAFTVLLPLPDAAADQAQAVVS